MNAFHRFAAVLVLGLTCFGALGRAQIGTFEVRGNITNSHSALFPDGAAASLKVAYALPLISLEFSPHVFFGVPVAGGSFIVGERTFQAHAPLGYISHTLDPNPPAGLFTAYGIDMTYMYPFASAPDVSVRLELYSRTEPVVFADGTFKPDLPLNQFDLHRVSLFDFETKAVFAEWDITSYTVTPLAAVPESTTVAWAGAILVLAAVATRSLRRPRVA